MKKILLFFTGGTIGSEINENKIDVGQETTTILVDLFEKEYSNKQINFTVRQPLNILSENILPSDWQLLIHQLQCELSLDNYDGVIITHGTDTLPYTAAAVSYLFSATTIPIILIASNHPIVDTSSDGFVNFVAAVNIIEHDSIPKVLAIFQNHKQEVVVYLGTRMTQSTAFKHDYDNFSDINLGVIENGRLSVQNSQYTDVGLLSEGIRDAGDISFRNQFNDDILYIKPYPGLRYEYIVSNCNYKHKPKAILHDLYHSGTASTNDKYSIIKFIDACTSMGIDFYLTSIEKKSLDYSTTNDILKTSAVPIYNMLTEASLVKLMLAYGNKLDKNQIDYFLNKQTIADEHLIKKVKKQAIQKVDRDKHKINQIHTKRN